MSRPTEIMLVASATSTPCAGSAQGFAKASFAAATLSVFSRDVSSSTSRRRRFAKGWSGGAYPSPLGSVAREFRAYLVLDDAACAAEFAQRVEVAERREIGIGVAAGLRFLFGCRQQRGQCAQKDQLWPLSGRGEADIQAGRLLR